MNKLLLVIPFLLLASTYYVFRSDALLMDSTDDESYLEPDTNPGCARVTYTQWKTCIYNARIPKCDDLPENQRSSCYNASYLATKQMWPSVPTATCACTQFWKNFERANANDYIDFDGSYHRCFSKSTLIAGAKSDKFYYTRIFAPQYLTCAGLRSY
ncbi:P28 protein (macronuclear) [Tetrahymena thermophila SB210]|uniref:P28 protein n=1 Tax=Tetrahymena thermophila (strain SB210) TaxID=312017 RepID=Q22NY5_TETTS|nr:P28 protein [Tetrahymena thermophila SB210]EAR87026.1 P28 protein [Tetrahymena thermophila SB210]|eukprot:XP_001007271.1 P28 protein [Tetrahymena thermophila SB210]